MRRVHGPYRHHDRWRIKIIERRTGKVTHQSFSTEEEARAAVRSLRRRLAWETGVSVADALNDYEKCLVLKGNKPRTVLTTMYRLRRFFGSVGKLAVVGLTPTAGQKLYDDFTQGKTKRGQTMSVDSARNTLAEAKTFLGWAVTKRWARANALAEVKGIGKRRRGKPQLTVDEARRWMAVGMEMAAKERPVTSLPQHWAASRSPRPSGTMLGPRRSPPPSRRERCGSWREISGRFLGRREHSPLTAPRERKKVPARSRGRRDRRRLA